MAPAIPFPPEEAFYPLKRDSAGKFPGVHYTWRECANKFLGICTSWELKETIFRFDDPNVMEWFDANDFGFKKRETF